MGGEPSLGHRAVSPCLVFFGCLAGAALFAQLNFPSIGGALLFPQYAVLAAAMLVEPPRRWPVLLLAATTADFVPHLQTGPTPFVLLTELANFTRVLIVAWAVRRFAKPQEPLDGLRGTVVFLIAAVAVAPAVAALIGARIVVAFRPSAFWPVWRAWFFSNALTALTLLVPLWLLAARRRVGASSPRRPLEAVALTIGLLAAGFTAFVALSPRSTLLHSSMFWPLPFMLWAAVRFGPTGVSASLLAVTTFALWGARARTGPLLGGTPAENLLHMQLFLIVTAVPLLLVAALVEALRVRQAEYDSVRDDERKKDEFLAMLGHELRNPLAPMGAALMMLDSADSQRHASARKIIERQVGFMERLVGDLVDVSRITRGDVELRRARIDLAQLGERAIEMVRPQMEARRHKLTIRLLDEPVAVWGDAMRLTQVVVNLLNNAAKYTAPGGRIVLLICRDGEKATLSVQDNGVGLSEEMREKVFEPFERGEHGAALAAEGLGVGLTLARRLVELHGGTLTAYSKGAGLGSEFVVRLPRHVEPAAKTKPAAEAAPAEPPKPAPLDVLVVDDDAEAAEALGVLVELWGHVPRVVHDGSGALDELRRRAADVVLSDLTLPQLGGLELARAVRSDASAAGTLLVAITGHGRPADHESTRAAGFDHHFEKPIDLKRLEALLGSTAAARRLTPPPSAR